MVSKEFLRLEDVSKTFPGVKALDGIHLDILQGEVHALVGENGAGKSTLIKILSGIYDPDDGAEIVIEGERASINNPLTAMKMGIAVIYQDFSLFPNLTVAENISISVEIGKGKRYVGWKGMKNLARIAIGKLGLDIDVDAQLGKLSVAKQQLVAIARALVCDAKMIIMDEPTSALSKNEVEALFNIINNLRASGISVLFVSHKLEEVFEISDRITVFRDGKYMGTYLKEQLDSDRLISLMVGRTIQFERYKKGQRGKVLLEVRSLSKKGNFKDISFSLHEREVIGITGLVGAGRTELAQAIFGINIPDEGEVFLEGKKVNINSPDEAIKKGIAYVPEGRQTEGLIMKQPVEDNITITIFDKLVKRYNFIDFNRKKSTACDWVSKLNIKTPHTDVLVQQLSGGNQQRVVIAKWLAASPKVLIVDEPTNGIDVGAKSEIHQILKDLASRGIGILMISSELPEILAVSDRVLVMRRGRIAGEFDGDNATQEEIMNKAILSTASNA